MQWPYHSTPVCEQVQDEAQECEACELQQAAALQSAVHQWAVLQSACSVQQT
jgi:hypothetical protein